MESDGRERAEDSAADENGRCLPGGGDDLGVDGRGEFGAAGQRGEFAGDLLQASPEAVADPAQLEFVDVAGTVGVDVDGSVGVGRRRPGGP